MSIFKTHKVSKLICLSFYILSAVALANTVDTFPVKVTQVTQLLPITSIEVSGHIHSLDNSHLSVGVSGRVLWVKQPGEKVIKGETIAQIDPDILLIEQSEKQALITLAKVNINYLTLELTRLKPLLTTNNVSQGHYDKTIYDRDLAQSKLTLAQVELRKIQKQLERTILIAPFSGVVVKRFKRQGEEVSVTDNLLQLVNTDRLEIRVLVPLSFASTINDSTILLIKKQIENAKGIEKSVEQRLKITQLIPFADSHSQQVELRATILSENFSSMIPGQLVNAKLLTKHQKPMLAVHQDALLLRQDGTYIVVIDAYNQVRRIKVETGRSQGEKVIVSGAIKYEELVVIRGAENLKNGERVTIQP
jgi:RND family efflux transporter MFP subunit